ncbi:hypothetical protein AK812_SmicGene7536 [Symbiodinium microadriaticum]|uniref:Uncharacterized protein n=1 Tax=Symbiodinium microadriaticum TaxID=2951 RepID=A0A1Q9ENG8_SYMMI|nr:hypothetical protein AK812_SmicGene7536 [Symbiodinium microadriaticum]
MGAEDNVNDAEKVCHSLADSDVPLPDDLESHLSFASRESEEDPGSSAEMCARIVIDMQLVEPAMLRATSAAVVLNRSICAVILAAGASRFVLSSLQQGPCWASVLH